MTDYATDKRTQWVKEAQEISWVEVIEAKDFVMILILLNLILAILILA
jgi:hypothetical protein